MGNRTSGLYFWMKIRIPNQFCVLKTMVLKLFWFVAT